jgi:hypothetical protein
MHKDMNKQTRKQVLERLRRRYVRAGRKHKGKLIDEAVELLGYHRKAAIRALKPRPQAGRSPAQPVGRPREYEPAVLLPVLKPIWLAAYQPCGGRLAALLPEWLPAYEEDHKRLDGGVRECLLLASARTLDRLLEPLRAKAARRGGTRPGSLLRQSIPIRGEWSEEGPGWLEADTVALCGGALDDKHLWMLDAVDIQTHWIELRALANRGQFSTLEQLRDLEEGLPFPLLGLDCDNGGEFINHHVNAWLRQRARPVAFTRGRPYHKNDNAHVEGRNWTHVRQHFGYERYDNPQVVPLINALCKGALGVMFNHFLPTHKLASKQRLGTRVTRRYGAALTPYARLLALDTLDPAAKARLRAVHHQHNPFQLRRDIERQLKIIDAMRLLAT